MKVSDLIGSCSGILLERVQLGGGFLLFFDLWVYFVLQWNWRSSRLMERVEEPNREGKDCLSVVPTHGCVLNILSVHMKTSVDPEENSANIIEGTFINPLLGKTH